MKQKRYVPVLTIAGSDCSGGAGIQADIKTMMAHGCFAMSAITALTAQNTTGVCAVEGVSIAMVADQIRMVCSDIMPRAVKTGMLFSADIVKVVAENLEYFEAKNLVVDPVMVSTSGSKLISDDAIQTMVEKLFPLAALVTPNRAEAIALTGHTAPHLQADVILGMGCRAVLLKGGDTDDKDFKTDYLYIDDGTELELKLPAVDTPNTHGTGCTLSSAIACRLALGHSMEEAVKGAKKWVNDAIRSGAEFEIGQGHGPVNHMHGLKCTL